MKAMKNKKKVIIKGYIAPETDSYYIVIPKSIRERLSLEEGEYFIVKAEGDDREIELKLIDSAEEINTTEDTSEITVATDVKKGH